MIISYRPTVSNIFTLHARGECWRKEGGEDRGNGVAVVTGAAGGHCPALTFLCSYQSRGGGLISCQAKAQEDM